MDPVTESTNEENNQSTEMPMQLYLLLAELMTGTTTLFGVPINAPSWKEGLPLLVEVMNKQEGRRFVPVINLQILTTVQYITCPSCESVVVASAGACSQCKVQFDTPEFRAAIQESGTRIIPKVQYSLKALMDGTENKLMLRPEHIMCYDIVSNEAPSYKKWEQVARASIEQMRALRSSIHIPTPSETQAVEATKEGKVIIP